MIEAPEVINDDINDANRQDESRLITHGDKVYLIKEYSVTVEDLDNQPRCLVGSMYPVQMGV